MNESERIRRRFDDDKHCKRLYSPTIPIGITGPTGPTGPAGPATITIGTVTTGAPGTEATVTNSGTAENVILDFVIPAGPTGPTGLTGPTGETINRTYW